MAVVTRFVNAANRHDADGVAACLHGDFDSIQPIYPGRNFRGADQVRRNWQAIFDAEPGFRLTVLRSAQADNTVWLELHGAGQDAEVAGVFVMGVEGERIKWARIYSALVEQPAAQAESTATATATAAPPPPPPPPAAPPPPPPAPAPPPEVAEVAEAAEVEEPLPPAAEVVDVEAASAGTRRGRRWGRQEGDVAVDDRPEAEEAGPAPEGEAAIEAVIADDAPDVPAATPPDAGEGPVVDWSDDESSPVDVGRPAAAGEPAAAGAKRRRWGRKG